MPIIAIHYSRQIFSLGFSAKEFSASIIDSAFNKNLTNQEQSDEDLRIEIQKLKEMIEEKENQLNKKKNNMEQV